MAAQTPDSLYVLIVEDDDACRVFVEVVLEDMGISFDTASNGAAAIEKVRQKKFDMIFMDLGLPAMNGYEITSAIRGFSKDVPVSALTAHAADWIEGDCKKCGMNDVLSKPFNREQLAAVIARWSGKAGGGHSQVL